MQRGATEIAFALALQLVDSTNVSLGNRGAHAFYYPNGCTGGGSVESYSDAPGELVITRLDAQTVEGTFHFKARKHGRTAEFTNGSFTASR